MKSTYKTTGKAVTTTTPWLSPMVMVKVTEFEEDVDRRGRTRTEPSSHVETLSKNLIACLPLQDLDGLGFEGLLSRRDLHTSHWDAED
jgi:hypothetical protein